MRTYPHKNKKQQQNNPQKTGPEPKSNHHKTATNAMKERSAPSFQGYNMHIDSWQVAVTRQVEKRYLASLSIRSGVLFQVIKSMLSAPPPEACI
jgi:hypothetical protein